MNNSRIAILDLWVDRVDRQQALEKVRNFVDKGDRPHSIFAVNPEKFFLVPKDPALHHTFKTADLLIPDGVGLLWAILVLTGIPMKRVPGVELMEAICDLAAKQGYRVFIYGAQEQVNRSAVERLQSRFPGLVVAGRSNGYVKAGDTPALIDKINASQADILFLALGSPKQEKWYATYKDQLKTVRVCQGIGGTLDTIAGNVKRAPRIWQKLFVEWLYRMCTQPERMKRQKVLPLFMVKVISAKLETMLKTLWSK